MIFLDICKGSKVMGHITGKSKPSGDDDEDWEAIDSRVKSWFYASCDPNLLSIISSDDGIAKDLWDELENFFLNNKMSRRLQLQDTFRNTQKGAMTITEYSHTLKHLADNLADVDSPINDIELVMQILQKLPSSYQSIIDVITHSKPFPTFLEAKNMLLQHETRAETIDPSLDNLTTSSSALYTSSNNTGNRRGKTKNNKNKSNGRAAPKGGNTSTVSAGSFPVSGNAGSGFSYHHGQNQQFQAPGQLQYAAHFAGSPHLPKYSPSGYTTGQMPPSPYGVLPHSTTAAQPPHVLQPHQPVSQPPPGASQPPQYSAFGGMASTNQPTDLASVFSSMSLQQPSQDPNFYMDTGATHHMTFNQVLCTNLVINCFPATGVSTIKIADQLNSSSQLVSPSNIFTLGFTTIPATNYTYLAIWYTDDDQSRRVWIANPSTPINSSSEVVLMIDPQTGKLIISTGEITRVNISDNQSGYSPNLTAALEDTGNFQLKNETDNQILWQSFDHPINVLLPGMKLGSDLKTGRSWRLTSWLTDDIPDSGAYTLNWEPNGKNSQRFMIRQRGQPYWTSGDLRNQTFEYMSINEKLFSTYNLEYLYNNEERYFSFNSINYRHPMWILRPQGRIVDGDNRRLITTQDLCYGYDLGNGCIEGSNIPRCRTKNDKFSPMIGEFNPELTTSSFDDNPGLSVSDCRVKCWNDCRCLGFINGGNGTGCVTWSGNKSVNNFSVSIQGNSVSKYVLISSNRFSKGNTKLPIWAPIVGAVSLLLVCIGLLWFLKKRKLGEEEERQMRDDRHLLEIMASESNGGKGSDIMVFSFASIVAATNDFSSENKLGQGGFGPVYKGKLHDEREIAIKRLSRTSGQGLVEFKNELILIAKLQHTNLVRVLGCCIHGEEKMLIYEYMPNKSLDFFLFDETRKTLLDWPKRWNIIEGIAQGLLYLHKYSRMRVIHRDLKASNVLLDENMNPKISDFGMARIFKENETEAMTKRVVGTYGYMSPEYAMEGTFSVKSDVFSFGVLILEIVSGRRNGSFSDPDTTANIVRYAWELWQQGDALELKDPTLVDTCIIDQLLRTVHVALLCVEENAMDRPVMSDVISMLINDTMLLPVPKQPAFFFGRPPKPVDYSVNDVTITELEVR